MKHYLTALLALLAVMCSGIIAPAYAAEEARTAPVKSERAPKAETTKASRPAGEALGKEMFDRSAPSEKANTDILLPLTGTWVYMATVWAPGAEPQKADGTITNQMALGNRFLSTKATGSLNIVDHYVPFEGEGLLGFDKAKKSFTSVWADSLTTSMAAGSGKFDAEKRTLSLNGKFTHPLTGAESSFRSEIRLVDAQHYTQTIFAADKSGKEAKLMEFEYTRN
ncbi:MAG: DUF1579 domain-containing protein [Alphaproteobacteria bacterium]|nr:MAG: DUF1579 domain-containing protein [Alphaproteobacteria bacterium]